MSGYSRPLPPSVYRRRRLAVFGGLLVVITVIVLLIVRPGFGESGGPTTEDQVAVDETAPPPPCTATQILLTAQTDAVRYNPGEIPQLWLTVENVSMADCEIEVGTLSQEYLITSGDDRIWSSKDCQRDGVPMKIVLKAGESRSTQAIPWDRTRSSESTCDGARPVMPGGGASYKLQVSLGQFTSPETRQFILN